MKWFEDFYMVTVLTVSFFPHLLGSGWWVLALMACGCFRLPAVPAFVSVYLDSRRMLTIWSQSTDWLTNLIAASIHDEYDFGVS